MSQPVPPPSRPDAGRWASFTRDPRLEPQQRASDADRSVAAEALNEAFEDGRLDAAEHSERLERALTAKTLGELVPVVEDISPVAPATPDASASDGLEQSGRGLTIRSGAVRSWLALALLFNVIWVASWLFSGIGPYYYWPIWPMLGTAIPVVVAWAAGARGDESPADGRRELYAERRDQRRDRRREYRAIRRGR